MDVFTGLVLVIVLMTAVLVGVRLSSPAHRRRRLPDLPDLPDLSALTDHLYGVPERQEGNSAQQVWTSTTFTTTVERPVEVPTTTQAGTPEPTMSRIRTVMQEMNQHLAAARFEAAVGLANELQDLVDSLPPDQREITIREATGGTMSFRGSSFVSVNVSSTVTKPKEAAEQKKIKTRFDLIG